MLPAPARVRSRSSAERDAPTSQPRSPRLDDADTRACVTAERALLAALEAGCTAPVGALAEVVEGDDGPELSLRAFVGAPDGSAELRRSLVAPVADPVAAGRRLAALLLEDGAADLARESRPVGTAADPAGYGAARWHTSTAFDVDH